MFEWDTVAWYDIGTGAWIDLTKLIPGDQYEYVAEAALRAYEDGGYGQPDPDAAYERERDRKMEQGR